MDSIFPILCCFLFVYSCVASYYSIKFAMILIKLEDEIEESIDQIDGSLLVFNKILEKPIFFDSVEVRQCINEIRKTRTIVVGVADKMTSISSQEIKEVNDNGSEKKEDSKKENDT